MQSCFVVVVVVVVLCEVHRAVLRSGTEPVPAADALLVTFHLAKRVYELQSRYGIRICTVDAPAAILAQAFDVCRLASCWSIAKTARCVAHIVITPCVHRFG